jgi:hypothetical protein
VLSALCRCRGKLRMRRVHRVQVGTRWCFRKPRVGEAKADRAPTTPSPGELAM